LTTLGLSIITNVARPDHPAVVHAEDVVASAQAAEPRLCQIVAGYATEICKRCGSGKRYLNEMNSASPRPPGLRIRRAEV
jgi:hypothetical protein